MISNVMIFLVIVVIMVILFYLFLKIFTNSSVFAPGIHLLFNELKTILMAQKYGMTDRFDEARQYIKSKNLTDNDLGKLKTYIQIKREQFSQAFHVNVLLVTVIIAFVTILVGTTITTTLGGLFGSFADKLYEEPEVAQLIFLDLMRYVDKANITLLIIFIGGIFGIGTWAIYIKYLSEISLGALRVVEQEQEERTKEREFSMIAK